jgi:hypothetical protein
MPILIETEQVPVAGDFVFEASIELEDPRIPDGFDIDSLELAGQNPGAEADDIDNEKNKEHTPGLLQ